MPLPALIPLEYPENWPLDWPVPLEKLPFPPFPLAELDLPFPFLKFSGERPWLHWPWGEGAAEYGGAGECGGSNRAVGRTTYRGYGEQSGAERAADGKQLRSGARGRDWRERPAKAWSSAVPGLGLAALCVAGRCCIENIELTCATLRGVDHARPWWPGSTMQLQRREYGKRLQRMGAAGPQTRPHIHPPPVYSARPPCMHQHTHRLHMQAPRRCPHPSPVWLYVDLRKASSHWGF